jgi:hypothetical protein
VLAAVPDSSGGTAPEGTAESFAAEFRALFAASLTGGGVLSSAKPADTNKNAAAIRITVGCDNLMYASRYQLRRKRSESIPGMPLRLYGRLK